MSDASVSVKSGKRTRTFTGCLTCRRRKVKCPGATRPCQTCCRLQLECVSPFPNNLRSATTTGRPKLQQKGPIKNGSQLPEPLKLANNALSRSSFSSNTTSVSTCGDNPTSPEATFYDLATPSSWDVASMQWSSLLHTDIFSFNQSPFPYDPVATEDTSDPPTFRQTDSSEIPPLLWQPYPINDSTLAGSDLASNKEDLNDDTDQCPNPTALAKPNGGEHAINEGYYPDSIGAGLDIFSPEAETSTMNHFKTSMTSTLSVKTAQWNIFSYLLVLSSRFEQSPIKSSIVCWAAARQVMEGKGASNEYLAHYAHSSAKLDTLLSHLSVTEDLSASQIEIILATTYCLCHSDITTCNTSSLVARLDQIKDILQRRWGSLSPKLTGTSSRLILWLGYLDIRRFLLTNRDGLSTEPFLEWVSKCHGLPQLYLQSRLYLKEAFGESYPSSELREDMIQDPVNTKFTEAMFLLGQVLKKARVSSSKRGCEGLDQLRQQVYELEKECDIALQGFTSEGSVTITRTSYHWLNLKAINNSSMILLSRLKAPQIRTEEEAQCAASEILKITIKLRKAKKLHNPHSVFSILPVFLAGIETTDEVHQDWVERFLEDVYDWGVHVQNASRLLGQVIERQNKSGCRLGLEDVANLATTPVIL